MKLSLDALKEKAELAVSEELLNSISGGMSQCHNGSCGYLNEWADDFWHWVGFEY